MTHHRVTPTGKSLGATTARLAEVGRQHLKRVGLDNVRAPGLRDGMCKSCACRPGTVPNGCLHTQLDFLKAAAEGKPFQCHSPLNGTLCTGWVRARAALAYNPLPSQVMALLAKHEYSPPDDGDIDDEREDGCERCFGDGMDPLTDFLLPCPACGGMS